MPIIEKKCDAAGAQAKAVKTSLEKLIFKEQARGDKFDDRINDLVSEIAMLKSRTGGVEDNDFSLL